MITQNRELLVLTESEHDAIREAWRAGEEGERTLIERYVAIHRTMLPSIALRLACEADEVPLELQIQVAHAVMALAIEYNHLQGSLAGELVAAVYYQGGGSTYLESYGRLCFCPIYPSKTARHASGCDQLWQAYSRAVDGLLGRLPLTPPPGSAPLCILDTTTYCRMEGNSLWEPERELQKAVASYLSLDEMTVRQVWQPARWQPSLPGRPISSDTLRALLADLQTTLRQKDISLFVKTVVLVVDDTAPATTMTALALALRRLMGSSPIVLGVRYASNTWKVVEPLPVVFGPAE